MSERGPELRAKYGSGELLKSEDNVVTFGHNSEEAARAFVDANLEDGYEAWVDNIDGQWCSVVDINPVLDRMIGNV